MNLVMLKCGVKSDVGHFGRISLSKFWQMYARCIHNAWYRFPSVVALGEHQTSYYVTSYRNMTPDSGEILKVKKFESVLGRPPDVFISL